jgi:hypothetical protein
MVESRSSFYSIATLQYSMIVTHRILGDLDFAF